MSNDRADLEMSPQEFRGILVSLGLGQRAFGEWLGHSGQTDAHWTRVAVPASVATLARLLRARPQLLSVIAELNGKPVPFVGTRGWKAIPAA